MDPSSVLRLLAAQRLRSLERMDAAVAQERVLLRLVRRAERTRFGMDHDFGRIRSVAGFQARVPIRQFDDFWAQYWRASWPILDNVSWPGRIPYFAKTSGTTTGRNKFIPITREIVKANERAGFDLMAYHLARNPGSSPLAGTSFILGGTTRLEEVAPGIFAGDVSGINTKLTPFWVKRRIFPSPELALIANWDEKLDRLSRLAVDLKVTMMSGMCNWVLFMLDRMRELRRARGSADRPTLPDLRLLVHGGVAMDLYRRRLGDHLDGAPVDLRELYPTSEGFIAFADRGPGEGLRMMVDSPLFLEFVPMSEFGSERPHRHWAATIEPDVDYALVLSNCAGLWSYLLGDVVRFVGTNPPRLLIKGRIAQKMSPFGEHLITAEIEEAVGSAARECGAVVVEFTVGPVFPQRPGETGYHVYVVELASPMLGSQAEAASRFARHIDAVLCATNYDYGDHRTGDSGVGPPVVRWVARGTFESWMRSRGKLGGQHKVPRVTPKPDKFAELAEELGVALDEASPKAEAVLSPA